MPGLSRRTNSTAADDVLHPVGSQVGDLRLVPIAAAAWLGTWVGTGLRLKGPSPAAWWSTDRWTGAAVLATLMVTIGLIVIAGLTRRMLAAATALVLAGAILAGGLSAHRLSRGPLTWLADERAQVLLEAVVRTDAQVKSGKFGDYASIRMVARSVIGRGQSWQLRTPVLVVISGSPAVSKWRSIKPGSTVAVSGRLATVERGSDVAAVLRTREPPTVRAPPAASWQLVDQVRAGLREAVSDRPPEPRALVPGLVLGDTTTMTPELQQTFATTGMTHLVAASGSNLALMLTFLIFTAKLLGVRGRWLRLVGLFGVIMFVGLCRAEPSVLRAAAMGVVTLAALGAGSNPGGGKQRAKSLRPLAVAVLLLVFVDPFLARSVGFALSVLACAGIVWWAESWVSAAGWLPRPLAEALAVPLAAHLATLPLVAAISGAVSISGLLANVFAGLLVGPATVLGFMAALTSLVSPWLASLFGWGASWAAQLIIWVAQLGAALPGASLPWPTSVLGLAALSLLALGIGGSVRAIAGRPWAVGAAILLLVVAMLTGPVNPGWPPRNWRLVACDVGQGDGLVLRAGRAQAVVVDVGGDPALMRRCLTQLRVRQVPLVVLTHFHADHVAGLGAVLGRLPVQQVWVSPYASPPAEAARVRAQAVAAGAVLRTPQVGNWGRAGDVSWQVIGPIGPGAGTSVEAGESAESGAENDASLVLRATVGGLAVLLCGDVEPAGQGRILAAGSQLRADVLKVPHHGSSRQDPEFFAATGARIAIASAGAGNSYGHPAPSTIRLATGLGMSFWRTDQQGSIAVTERDGKITVVTQRN